MHCSDSNFSIQISVEKAIKGQLILVKIIVISVDIGREFSRKPLKDTTDLAGSPLTSGVKSAANQIQCWKSSPNILSRLSRKVDILVIFGEH